MSDEERRRAIERARQVLHAHKAELLGKANVVGVGVGLRQREGEDTGEVVLVVMVSRKVPRAQLAEQDLVPREVDGVPVDVQQVGEFEAH